MKLIIEDDEGRRTVIPLVRDEITIGRNDQNMVRLEEKNVSRKHGRLVREEGHYYVEDLGSFTGIRVNGEKIKGKLLVKEGDLIQISEYDLMLQAGPDEKPAGSLGEDEDEATLVRKDGDAHAEETTDPARAAADAEKRKMADTATIRLSDLKPSEVETPQQEVPPEKRPRLVGISGTWRGKEFTLDKSPIRIGRSGDNDVEIEHPSISRRHFKLHLASDGTWKVLDAESRNGVRVNGEPYAQIGLKHGDVMEIGHLRFAFAEPGRPFKMPSEFAPMTPAIGPVQPPSGGLGLMIGIIAAAVVLAGTVTYFIMRHRAATSEDEGVEVMHGSKAERKFALRSAEEALAGHRYAEALRNLDAARRAGASAEELKDYNAVQAEARSEDLFREMESAASSQDWERARKLLGVLSSSQTFYGAKAAEKAEAITAGYVNLHVAAAALMKGKDNAGCLAEAQLALAANPQSADAQSLVESCKASAPAPAQSAAPAKPTAPPKVAAASVGRGNDDSAARQLVNDGNQKLVGQDYPGAIALYQKALALKPSDSVLGGIYRSMGIAYTRQGNIEEGARYYKLYLPLCTNADEKAQLQKVLGDYESSRR